MLSLSPLSQLGAKLSPHTQHELPWSSTCTCNAKEAHPRFLETQRHRNKSVGTWRNWKVSYRRGIQVLCLSVCYIGGEQQGRKACDESATTVSTTTGSLVLSIYLM